MEVICEIMELKPQSKNEYISLHDNTWPEIIKALRKSKFLEEYIFILGNIVIIFIKCESYKDSKAKLNETDIFKKWTTKVRKMLIKKPVLFNSDDVLIDLKPIWNLNDFDEYGFLKNPI